MADLPDPTRRFSDRAADYSRWRPGYPPGLLPLLTERLGLRPSWVVADVGSGTGLSALPFLEHGNRVVGVEPNGEMRAEAERVLAAWPGFRSVAGTAEDTGLEAASVDLAVAAQAFHWFDASATRSELLRVLCPPWRAVLLWNTRRTTTTPFLRGYEDLLRRHGTDYERVRHDRLRVEVFDAFFEGGRERTVLANAQELDLEGLTGRVCSSSYTPPAGDPRREVLLLELRRLFEAHAQDGRVVLEYDTEVHWGLLAGRSPRQTGPPA